MCRLAVRPRPSRVFGTLLAVCPRVLVNLGKLEPRCATVPAPLTQAALWRRRRARGRWARGRWARRRRARRRRARRRWACRRRVHRRWARGYRTCRCRARRWLTWLQDRGIDRWLPPLARAAVVGKRLCLLFDHHAVAIAAKPERGRRNEAQERARAPADREARSDVVARELACGEAERAADEPGRHRWMIDGEGAPRPRGQHGNQHDRGERPGLRAAVPGHPGSPKGVTLGSLGGGKIFWADVLLVVGQRHAVPYHRPPVPPNRRPGSWHLAPACASRDAFFCQSSEFYTIVIIKFLGYLLALAGKGCQAGVRCL